MTETQASSKKRNPFLVALTVLPLAAGVVSGICAIVGAGVMAGRDAYLESSQQPAALIAAWVWLNIAGVFLIATLMAGAITWRRPS